jgi:hypothetical protein
MQNSCFFNAKIFGRVLGFLIFLGILSILSGDTHSPGTDSIQIEGVIQEVFRLDSLSRLDIGSIAPPANLYLIKNKNGGLYWVYHLIFYAPEVDSLHTGDLVRIYGIKYPYSSSVDSIQRTRFNIDKVLKARYKVYFSEFTVLDADK